VKGDRNACLGSERICADIVTGLEEGPPTDGLLVAPANAVLATWQTGPIPADFDVFRKRWETGHMIVAAFKLCGFVLLRLAIAGRSLNGAEQTSSR
jgi:hypothetical protein